MPQLLWGGAAAAALDARTAAAAAALRRRGVIPTLAVLRVGEDAPALSYERGAAKRCAAVGVRLESAALPAAADDAALLSALAALNARRDVHGILLLQPLPAALDAAAAREAIAPEKDVDGGGSAALAAVYAGTPGGFAPCTARAILEILRYYGVACAGKRAVVVGRSLVVGRPTAMLLLRENATVTLCHSGSEDLPALTRAADILVLATGRARSVGKDCLRNGQVVIDAGIGWDAAAQRLVGDLRGEEAETLAAAYTPVPGGVGAVTNSVLAAHTVEAAGRQTGGEP